MEVLKRSNSCETFKQIKSIFKSKSKPNLTTTSQNSRVYEMNTLNTLNNYTLTTIPSNREQYSGKTNRNIIEMAFNQTSRK